MIEFSEVHKLFYNPYSGFLTVATTIMILILIWRWLSGHCAILWKSTLISYIVFLIFTVLMYIGDDKLNNMIPYTGFILMGFSFILLTPGLLIYGLIPGVIKPCPSDNDVLGWFTCGFLFYSIVIWGILKLIKKSEKSRTIEIKQNNEAEKQTPTETDMKGV